MSGKAANLNGVLENQDSDLHWQVAFSEHNRHDTCFLRSNL